MILVTGASGLIGKRLVRALAERAELQVLIRGQTPSPFSDIEHVRVCRGDISDYAAVERAFSGVTEVIHLAAAMHGSEREYIDGTLRGTENVIRCCLEKQVNKLLYMSSLCVLSLSKIPYGAVADESWEYEPLPERRGLYSKYKLLAEQCVVDAVRRHGLSACILRPTEVLQRDAPHLSFATGFKIGTMTLSLIDKRANVPLIEIDDLVSVMLRLLDVCDFRGEIINIVDPIMVSQSEYLTAYVKRTTAGRLTVKIPLSVFLTLAKALDLVSRFSGVSFPVSVHSLRSAIGPRHFSSQALHGYIGNWEFGGVRAFLHGAEHEDTAPHREQKGP